MRNRQLNTKWEIKIFEEGIVSTGREVSSISFTPDGKTAYFCRESEPPFFIMESHFENGIWSNPCISSFSGKYHDVDPFVSPDGKRLYFSSRRPSKLSEVECSRIWYAERSGELWGEPIEFEYPINTDYNEVFPAVTNEGTLYFTSSRPGGKGFSDIYYSKFVDGRYTEPCRLGDAINTDGMEFDAFIAPDESYILFTRKVDKFGFDIFISLYKNNSWTEAKSISELLGITEKMRVAPSMSENARRIYFTSEGNICYIDDFDFLIKDNLG